MALLKNEEFVNMLNSQIAHEDENSHIYLSISNYFSSNFLVGWGKYFREWSEEETKHRNWIVDHMNDRGCAPIVGKLNSDRIKLDFKNIKEVLSLVISTEEETTAKLYNILSKADELNEWFTVELATKMVAEQIEEEQKARKLFARLSTANWDGTMVSIMDKEFND